MQYLVNQFKAKEMRKIYTLSQIIKQKDKHSLSIHFKNINFILGDLQLTEKEKKSRVKLDLPMFIGQTCLDKSKILFYVFKYEYMILKWGKN